MRSADRGAGDASFAVKARPSLRWARGVRFFRSARATCLTAGALVTLAAGSASAYCRSITADVPAGAQPSGTACYPVGTQGAVLYWAGRCIGWSLQGAPSTKLDLAVAKLRVEAAFSAWSGAACPTGGAPSIAFSDNGPVSCTTIGYVPDRKNQHVIAFRDGVWPYPGHASSTLALTTLTFNTRTGEIVDGDMEINTAENRVSTEDVTPLDSYDFQSIVTHEAGHFLGLAHAVSTPATMHARYSAGETAIRRLSEDDVAGICEIYRPSGVRSVSTGVVGSGTVEGRACDANPLGGFSATCDALPPSTPNGGTSRCAYAAPRSEASLAGVMALAFAWLARARRRSA